MFSACSQPKYALNAPFHWGLNLFPLSSGLCSTRYQTHKNTDSPTTRLFFYLFFLLLTLLQSCQLYPALPLSTNSAHHDVIALWKLQVFDCGYILACETENALYPTHFENKVDDPPLHVVHSPLIPKNPPMPLLQLRLVRQRQRHKTVEWKEKLASRLCFMDATFNMCCCLLDVISLSFVFVSPILALAISAIPEFVSQTPHLQPIRVSAALLGMALQLCVLCGAIGCEPFLSFILDPVWHCKQKPSLTLQLQPDMSLVGMCTGHCHQQAIHGPSLYSAQHPGPFIWVCTRVLINTHMSLWNHFAGLDPEVKVRDVMADLRHRRLIPELSRWPLSHISFMPLPWWPSATPWMPRWPRCSGSLNLPVLHTRWASQLYPSWWMTAGGKHIMHHWCPRIVPTVHGGILVSVGLCS